jgi:2-iminobutanoate/2-iminopropanoate deaminase
MPVHEIPSGTAMPATLGSYSNVVRAGDFLFVSGQMGIKPGTRRLANHSFPAEARQALENLAAVLRAAGSDLDRVVKISVCLADANHFLNFSTLFAEFFHSKPPAQFCFIARLPEEVQISIDCVALA